MNNDQPLNRRSAIRLMGALAASAGVSSTLRADKSTNQPYLATNTYPWKTFAKRSGQEYARHTDALLEKIANTGIRGYEPIIESHQELPGLAARLQKHGLEMRSIYVNSVLHDESKADQSIETVIGLASAASKLGAKIVVTNPSPIRWGGNEDKSDRQLRFQARSLDRLGAELRKRGLTLAYHNHDAELRQGGREFHHMLTATAPENVKFCLDSHWVFRGCGDSEVAVFDALKHYHNRIVELHLRQSNSGVWNEAFAMQGDINYVGVLRFLAAQDIHPLLVLEQAVEEQSTQKLDVVEAHTRGRVNLAQALN